MTGLNVTLTRASLTHELKMARIRNRSLVYQDMQCFHYSGEHGCRSIKLYQYHGGHDILCSETNGCSDKVSDS